VKRERRPERTGDQRQIGCEASLTSVDVALGPRPLNFDPPPPDSALRGPIYATAFSFTVPSDLRPPLAPVRGRGRPLGVFRAPARRRTPGHFWTAAARAWLNRRWWRKTREKSGGEMKKGRKRPHFLSPPGVPGASRAGFPRSGPGGTASN
jgi:hypothetical protein